MNEILVIGHRNPDTDSICSAIGYAEYKRQTGVPNAIAARCGDTNERIDFVLATFGVPPPRFVTDVSPKVRDVMQHHLISVSPGHTVSEALEIMDERNIRVLPVIEEQHCRGLVSVFKMSKFFFPTPNRLIDSRRVLASINNLAKALGAKKLCTRDPDREEDLILILGAMRLESFTKRLVTYPCHKMLLVVGDRREIQETAIREGVRVIIVTGGLAVDADIAQAAREQGVSILISPHDSATTAMLARAAISVKHMIQEEFVSFREDENLSRAKQIAAQSSSQAFPVLDAQKRIVGFLSKSDFLKKIDRQLILVDHNELSQAVEGAAQVDILEVVDHHRIGLTTQQPILFRNEPVGSTSTIVADCFYRSQIPIPKPIAGLLLAGVVSDTLNLTSPTTTARDAEILGMLEQVSEINATKFTEKLFASGSVLISRAPEQAITADCKEYTEENRRFSVAQVEELGFDQFYKLKEGVATALANYRSRKGFFFSALLVTDVVRQTSLLLVVGDERFVSRIDYPKVEPGIYDLKGIVSRKKQLLPYLTHCLADLK